MHGFSLKNELQKRIIKFCFSQWPFENSLKVEQQRSMLNEEFCLHNFLLHLLKQAQVEEVLVYRVRKIAVI